MLSTPPNAGESAGPERAPDALPKHAHVTWDQLGWPMSKDAFFATLMDYGPDALLVFDDRGVIHYINKQAERLFGYPTAELLHSPLPLLLPNGLSQLPNAGASVTMMLEARHKAGRRMLVEASVARAELATGALFSVACRARSQLLQVPDSSRCTSELLASISHELRSPLNVIIGFAKLMYKRRVGAISDAQREYLGDILDSGERLLEHINDFVELAKLEGGKTDFQPEPISLSLVLHELNASLEGLARAKNITLSVEAGAGEIEHDPDKLKQVLRNVLSYALRVTPPTSVLRLRAHAQEDNHVRFGITGGSGFATDCAAQLVDGGLLRSLLTYRLAEHLGAHIDVCSEHSSLSIVLPRRGTASGSPNPHLIAT